jgi:diguanylate cyclase (GGDEF)-like protein/PAS domain S-box-containing protein
MSYQTFCHVFCWNRVIEQYKLARGGEDMKAVTESIKQINYGSAASAQTALRDGQFVPYFQPIVELRSGQLAGFEVLARWRHPQHGLVSPDQFISLAEKQGWIDTLTQQLLLKAFADAKSIPEPLTLSVNISPVQLRNSTLQELIRNAAERTEFSLKRLIVEITESALIDNLDHARKIADELKAMGCKLALDDFGTGYSSLSHLQSLPFDELKVDRSFVSSMTERRESRKIVAGVVGLGQSLGLRTVAEGIETREQAEAMLWLGCDFGQGWYYGRPMPAEDIPSVLATLRRKLTTESVSPLKTIADLDGPLSQRIAHLQAVYDGAPVGLCFLDKKLRHANINQRLADFNGIPISDHIGRTVAELVHPDLYRAIEPYLLRALKGEVMTGLEVTAPPQPGKECRTFTSSYQPAFDEAGEVIGISIAVLDTSQAKRTEITLLETEVRHSSTLLFSPHIPWIMDSEGRNLEVSPLWETITGQTPEQTLGFGFQAVIHPDDLQALMPYYQSSFVTGKPIDVEYRIRTKEGDWLWMRSRGRARRGSDGQIIEWYGTDEDINELKGLKSEIGPRTNATRQFAALPSGNGSGAELAAILQTLEADPVTAIANLLGSDWSGIRQIFQSVPTGITIADVRDPEMPLVYVNRAFETITGYTMEEVRGRNCRFLQGNEINEFSLAPLRRALSERRDASAVLKNFRKDGTRFRNELRLSPIRDRSGDVTHYIGIQTDVTTRVELQEDLMHLAHHDPLTGLVSRVLLLDRMVLALQRAERAGRMVAVLFLDMDNLKLVNDGFGFDAGDAMLKCVAHRLQSAKRKHETAARLGGDEFIVMLEDLRDEDEAAAILQRLTDDLHRPMWTSQGRLDPSASIGMAIYPRDGRTPGELLRAADLAAFTEKNLYRDTGRATLSNNY